MTPVVALLVAVGEILGVCAVGMGVYGLWRLRLLRRRDVQWARSLTLPRQVTAADDPVNVEARQLWGEQA